MRTSSCISTSDARRAGRSRGYFTAAAVAAGLTLLVCFAVNLWIDPFNKLGRNWIGVHTTSERDAKPAMLVGETAWRGVILGSSKTTYIDPLELVCPGFFNASFPGAVPEEILDFVRNVATRQELALIGLDFFMFNERSTPWRPDGLGLSNDGLVDRLSYLLGGRVLVASIRDLWRYWRGTRPRLAAAGNRVVSDVRQEARTGTDGDAVLEFLASNLFAGVEYSHRRLAALRELRALWESRGTRYVVFVNPLDREVLDVLKTLPAYADFQRFRRDVRAIFPEMIDLSKSRWSDSKYFFRLDPYHYLPSTGAAFTNAILPPLCNGTEAAGGVLP